MEKKDTTEQKILEAAHDTFLVKGMDGARMQEIADGAGINKALLHYYFRSKQKLFEAVFAHILKHAFPNIIEIFNSQKSVEEKMNDFVDKYMEILLKNPYLPNFLLKEVSRDPDMIAGVFIKTGLDPKVLLDGIKREFDAEGIEIGDVRHFVVNLIAMMVFPFAARPLIQRVIFENDKRAYSEFLKERGTEVKKLLQTLILKK
ncbi:MAG: TetR/AcrR family transcriptional regulator [Bacteroidales bacterium]|nr:TetR/AcrR family transcriptional regulator [Bacteroidales bacterium]